MGTVLRYFLPFIHSTNLDFLQGVKCHEKYLAASLKHKSVRDQERAYRELGMAHKNLGNLQQALVRKEEIGASVL